MSQTTTPPARAILTEGMGERTTHWGAVQANKARLSGFMIATRGLSVVVGTFAAKDLDGRSVVVLPLIATVLMLWALDGYFLRQERMYRRLGEDVRAGYVAYLDMNAKPYSKAESYLKAVFSWTVPWVHVGMLATLIVTGLVSV